MLKVIGYEECFDAISVENNVDLLDRAAVMSRLPSKISGVGGGEEGRLSSTLPSAQFSAFADDSLLFGHMGFIPSLGMCVKTGMQVPGNSACGLDTVQAAVLLFDENTGVPQALIDGRAITVMRTAGALIAGVREVLDYSKVTNTRGGAVQPPRVAVVGYGAQGRYIARLAREVLHADTIKAFNRSTETPEEGVEMVSTIAEAVADADVIACATSSAEPVLFLADVRKGQILRGREDVVIASLNSHEPDKAEIDPQIIGASASVHLDVDDPMKFGPIAQWKSGQTQPSHETAHANFQRKILGERSEEVDEAHDYFGQRGIRTLFIGGHGLQDSLLAWSVLLGWSAVETTTGRYTDAEGR
ncbi:hypothetical protein [Brevibacterium zhoupengii]|uniref:hypothetical protein n=1 Tax=Brevibacterium zhoupengii TaxID=2898795 RepID=UPI001E2ECB48|nr:hypothetical protein [Brevibacterium zhoupengii]